MKKLISLFCAAILLAGLNLQAAPVSSNKALDIAKKIFAAQPATKAGSGSLKIIWDGEDVPTKSVQPAFYVITRDGGGFVIISGDDNVPPVLAISDHNEFYVEGMPENVKWWMARMKAYVRAATVQSQEVKEQWARYVATKAPISGEVTNKVEKLTPEWDQGNNDPLYFGEDKHVFNAKCPLDGTTLSLTGCVATAMAELLTYQSGQTGVSMPASATGKAGGYTPAAGYVAPALYTLGTTYDWDNLRTLSNIAAVKAAVDASQTDLLANLGQLMADMGAMVQASYSKDGTSAVTEYVIPALIEHMGFNKGAYYAEAADYSSHQWIELLKNELDKRPLIYSGRTSGNAGHAFIFDGYGQFNGDDVFHVNFGWGGSPFNGYYYHTNLDSGNGNYSYQCGAIFDLYPNPTSTYPVKLVADYDNSEWRGINAKLLSGNTYRIYYNILNKGQEAYTGKIKLAKKDKSNTVTYISDEISYSVGSNASSGTTKDISISSISFGDQIVCYYLDGEDWKLLGCTPGAAVSAWPLIPAAFIKTNNSYNQNEWFTFELMNYDDIYSNAKWTITAPDGTTSSNIPQTDYEFQLTQKGKYKIAVKTAQETIVTYIYVN